MTNNVEGADDREERLRRRRERDRLRRESETNEERQATPCTVMGKDDALVSDTATCSSAITHHVSRMLPT